MGFLQTTDLAKAESFRTRLIACIVKVAGTVLNEDQTQMGAARRSKRQQLSLNVFQKPEEWVDSFIWPTLSNATIAAAGLDAPDGDMEYQVGQVWDLLAGVTGAEKAEPPPA